MTRLNKVGSFKTKTDLAYDFLKVNILNRKFRPGEKIVIKDIAKRLNVSDIPVREAIKKLETQGLVISTPHVGASVVKIRGKEIEEIYIIRSELEGLATRLASEHIKEKDFNKLEKIIEESEKALRSGKYEKLGELNKQFHLEICKCSQNKLLLKLISDLWESSYAMRSIFVLSSARRKKSQKEHRLILEALKQGKGNLAAEIVRKQKIESWNAISKFMEE